jgi:anti-sigma factor RsiW
MLPTNPLLNATAPAGPHLPVALLRQYAAGALAPAAQHRVEAHTLACPRCADMLAGLQQTPPATTDQALAHLQQRLRQRVQQQTAPARHDREAQRNRWLIPQLAAAAALLLGLVAAPKPPAACERRRHVANSRWYYGPGHTCFASG